MNKKTLLVLGTFWIFVVALVSATSVAADGMYWGDSIGDTDDSIIDEPVFVPVQPQFINYGGGNFFILSGMYWGD